jgi:hypothetical protein
VTLHLNDALLLEDTPCPPRVYHLLLPAQRSTLVLTTDAWEPRSLGIERDDGPLGVWLQNLEITADGQPVPLHGALVPIIPLPPGAGPVTIRQWTSDYRYGHWDFWWWFLAHSGFPAGASLLLAAVWLIIAFGLAGWGARVVWIVYDSQRHKPLSVNQKEELPI